MATCARRPGCRLLLPAALLAGAVPGRTPPPDSASSSFAMLAVASACAVAEEAALRRNEAACDTRERCKWRTYMLRRRKEYVSNTACVRESKSCPSTRASAGARPRRRVAAVAESSRRTNSTSDLQKWL